MAVDRDGAEEELEAGAGDEARTESGDDVIGAVTDFMDDVIEVGAEEHGHRRARRSPP